MPTAPARSRSRSSAISAARSAPASRRSTSRGLRRANDARALGLQTLARLHTGRRRRRPRADVYEPKRKLTAAAPPVVDATILRVKNVRLKDQQTERALALAASRASGCSRSRQPSRCARAGRRRSPRSAPSARPHAAPDAVSSSTSAPGSRGLVAHADRGSDPRDLRARPQLRRAQLSFASPLLLLGLLLLPLIVLGYRHLQRRPNRYAVRYTNLDVLATVVDSTRSWRRHAGLALFLLALAALARRLRPPEREPPRRPRGGDDRARDRRLRVDAGEGRRADAARGRAERRPRLHEGAAQALPGRGRLVLGDGRGRRAGDLGPAARDRRDRLPLSAARDGDRRRARARRRGRAGRRGGPRRRSDVLPRSCSSRTARRPRVCSLPHEGAARAKSFKIPVYTIALGTPEGVVEFNRFGGTRIIPVPPDKPTLRQIAATTGGRFYEAESVGDLRTAYDKMGSLVSKVKRKQEVTFVFSPAAWSSCSPRPDRGRDVPEAAVRYLLAVLAAAALAGCSGDDKGAAPPLDGCADGHRHASRPRRRRPPRRRRIAPARSPMPSRASSRRSSTSAPRRSAAGGARARGSCSTGAGSSSRTTTSSRARRRVTVVVQRRRAQAADGRDGDRDRARRRISPSSASRRPTSFHSRSPAPRRSGSATRSSPSASRSVSERR